MKNPRQAAVANQVSTATGLALWVLVEQYIEDLGIEPSGKTDLITLLNASKQENNTFESSETLKPLREKLNKEDNETLDRGLQQMIVEYNQSAKSFASSNNDEEDTKRAYDDVLDNQSDPIANQLKKPKTDTDSKQWFSGREQIRRLHP